MEKINFVNNQPPYINAPTLNQLQDNIENGISGIIESGSNENGNYVKYADGTMICYSYVQTGTNTYPQEFIANPLTVVMPVNDSTSVMHLCQATTTPSQITISSFWANISNSLWQLDQNLYVNYLAIGKWK